MKKSLIAIFGIATLVGGAFLISAEDFFAKDEEGGPFPSDWFMMQRTWPDEKIEAQDYFAAMQQAERTRENSLDDPPPWSEAGPNNIGGRITDIVGHPTNQDLFYVAAASGGIFKTTNGGTNWTAIFDDAPTLSMGALAMDPTNSSILYAGTGEANSAGFSYFGSGMYKTTNAGATWEFIGLENSRYIARVVVSPTNPEQIWVAAMGELFDTSQTRGIYLSDNGGESWEQKLFVNDSTGASDVVVHPENSNIVYAAMWQRIRNPEVRRVGGRHSGIYKSTNGGDDWERLEDGLPPVANDIGRIGLAISQSNPEVLYACYADDPGNFLGVFRTTNGGESWSQVNDGALSNMYSNFGWYFGNIRVRPDDEDVVFVLGQTLYRSMNGGQSWTDITGNAHVDHHALWFHPGQPFRALLGNDGGMYRTLNNGNDWAFLTGLPVNQFYAATIDYQQPQRLYGGTQDQGTMRTMTGSLVDWDRIFGGDGFYCNVDPTNSNVIYAEYQYGQLHRSDDGGDGWNWIMDGINPDVISNWCTPVVMNPRNPHSLYYGSERVYKTVNRGDNWMEFSPELVDPPGGGNLIYHTVTCIGVSPLDTTIVYAGTDDANVWVTTNNGSSWQNRSAGLPNRWMTHLEADPFDSSTVYVTASGYRNVENDAHIFKSENFGLNWEDISGDLPDGPLNDVVADPAVPQKLYVASDFGVFYSENSGAQWFAMDLNIPRVPVIDLVLHNPTRTLVAATYGRSMFKCDLNVFGNLPPVITGWEPEELDTVYAPATIAFSVSAMDPNGDTLYYNWIRNGENMSQETTVDLTFSETRHESIFLQIHDGTLPTTHTWDFEVVDTTMSAEEAPVPANLFLINAYPNPFNSSTTIEYQIPRAGNVTIRVVDIQGREVAELFDGFSEAGTKQMTWNAQGVASGTYIVEGAFGGLNQTQKVMLVR